ncbi:MAG TPA: aminotransferase class I/II-fold pyridoxal phosphate-dependent enzyme [Solirubrobacteraceae bacterium]|nr:aminotransferase class I/II-fold pyridoxal phosphate-dependent enzyme [Solirubrobacteraceae bacterium]
MDVDALREQNQQKAAAEGERGPVRKAPDAAPIGDAIMDFHRRGDLSFGIPAHRGGMGDVRADAAEWAGDEAFRADQGMNNGVDNRHQSWQVEPTAMELFAEAVGADQTLFSTNGSTENVHVAMMTVAKPGETIVMARNGHKSAFSGLVLSGVRPVYVDPQYDERWQVAHGPDPADIERALDEHPEARAVMIFTPSYYGVSANIKAVAEIAHARGIPLVTDDAWGLDYSFCSRLPEGSIASGADIAIGSVHKTLNGFGQTSVLSVQGDLVDTTRLELVFELEQSTSASALLLSSIDAARRQFQRDGEELLGAAIDRANRLREAIEAMPGLDLMGDDVVGGPGAFDFDPTHVTFDTVGLGLTGFSAADWLRRQRGIHVELADHRRLMALVTYADSDDNIDRLIAALRDLCEAHGEADRGTIPDVPYPGDLRMETVMLPRDAFLGATEMVPWRAAAGRISAEMICPYPPGIPITAPGERLTPQVVDYLEQLAGAGVMVEGAADETLEKLRVVAV